jgi:hypothetical protein
MAKNRKKARETRPAAERETEQDNSTVQVPEGEKNKKKRYKRKIKVKLAGAVSNFLILNAVDFRAKYDGDAQYVIRVDKKNKSMLDDLCERLKE